MKGKKRTATTRPLLDNVTGIRLQGHVAQRRLRRDDEYEDETRTRTRTIRVSRVATDERQISNIVLHERVGPLHVEIITSDVSSFS